MNILHITPYFNHSCGVSRYVYNLLKDFSENKDYKMHLITGKGDAYEKLHNIKVEFQVLELSGFPQKYFNLFKNYVAIKKFCEEKQIDLIHTHHRYPEYLSYLVSKELGVPTITTVQSLVSGAKKFSFKSNKIIAGSNAVKNNLLEKYDLNEDKIIVLYNYVEPFPEVSESEKEKFKTNLGIPADKKIILFVGRISRIKGCDILIKAFNQIASQKNIMLLMLGEVFDNDIYTAIQNNGKVKWYSPDQKVGLFYAISDMVVLPSRIDPFPYVMLETGMCKKPFIGANVDGIGEFIKDNYEGLLFKSGDVNELTEKIDVCLENEKIAERISENLWKKVTTKLDKQKYLQSLTSVYQELIRK